MCLWAHYDPVTGEFMAVDPLAGGTYRERATDKLDESNSDFYVVMESSNSAVGIVEINDDEW